MPQDAFTLRYVARELNSLLSGGKISKINQPARDLLSLLIYTRSGTVKLDIDLSAKYCRMSVGENTEYINPEVAPNFCMLLRKHLSNAELCSVEQQDFERVICLYFKCFSEFAVTDMQLYVEIMGKYSNAILVKNGIICGALKTSSLENNLKRVILAGARYLPPERQDKCDPTDLSALKKLFEEGGKKDADFIFNRVAGIAATTAQDIAEVCGGNLTPERLYGYVTDENYSPCTVLSGKVPVDFKARICDGAVLRESILKAQAEYYSYAVNKKKFEDGKRRLSSAYLSACKKAEKRLSQINSKLEECEKAEEIKLKGELITANIYAVERGMKLFEAVNYYDENGGKILIELDAALTPSQNAQKYFKKYAKLKRTAESLTAQKDETEKKLAYLKSIETNIALADCTDDLIGTEEELISLSLLPAPKQRKGAKKVITPYRTFGFEEFKVVCGRNNTQNDRLLKALSPTDIWLHAKGFHSCHAAILTGGKAAPDNVIKFAAEICAYYSEARENGKVPVDYTLKKFVKKPNGASAGFVVYTDFKTILVAPQAHTENKDNE